MTYQLEQYCSHDYVTSISTHVPRGSEPSAEAAGRDTRRRPATEDDEDLCNTFNVITVIIYLSIQHLWCSYDL